MQSMATVHLQENTTFLLMSCADAVVGGADDDLS
jgi:hypothetical protein